MFGGEEEGTVQSEMDKTTMGSRNSTLPELIDYDSHKTREGWDWMLDFTSSLCKLFSGRE